MGKSKELAELGDVVTQDSGNMLVGTTGHFNYSSGTTEITVGTDGTGSSAGGAVTFVSNNGATTLGYAGFQESEAAIGTMGSRALKLTTDNTARITVDASGRVTMPYQPAWSVSRTLGDTASGSIIVFDNVNTNIGNLYNTSNGYVTLPVSGRYFISFYSISDNNAVENELEIQVNGNRRMVMRDNSQNNLYTTFSMSAVLNLSANDVLRCRVSKGTIYGLNADWNKFSGYLIG